MSHRLVVESLLRGRSDEVNEKENRCFIGNLFTCTTIFICFSVGD
ncbi:hypothetical protein CUM54_07375 [Enterococcus faecalis]|uniref:Uncharacterized protein n=2 Tax=Enterococcus faecalis TaxID=1351 RepID=Q82Z81_ENTFA|nr:hypothetical protein EF_3189 [Enterococcus faecalis V583]AQL55010.1 hypothetical protein BZG32_15395 [Enterococcus faecalis]AUC59413.1 hypothetical protein CG806_14000 [Enterococcus faecalis ARO1/DG]AZV35174.1 hypothetical protein CVT43_12940 [Enterococcus faecalis OG1RF]EAC5385789.1 hypothetical protein [Listeria monocytogenes]EEU21939.1 hypothetical protein EFCG_02035 [Enterococcus faecalis T3]MRI76081.1 hypothetical protein [Enterococcus mundtii]OOC91002.1 hypothetical protein BWO99_13